MPIEDDSDPNCSFRKTLEEYHQMLLKILQPYTNTVSENPTPYLAIIDERSTRDETVLLVCTLDERTTAPKDYPCSL